LSYSRFVENYTPQDLYRVSRISTAGHLRFEPPIRLRDDFLLVLNLERLSPSALADRQPAVWH